MIRVLVADDQAVVRGGLRLILEAQGDIEVVAEAGDGAEVVELAATVGADVVLMDIRMPVLDGIEATRRLVARPHHPRVLVLTTYGLDENVYAALKAGAAGFLLKTDSPEDLVRAVRVVAAGESPLAPDITRRLIERFLSGPAPNAAPPVELSRLTDRERDVLACVAEGLTNAEIASALFVGVGTVKSHVVHILSKLGLRDRVQAVVFAYECGLVRLGQGPADPRDTSG